MKQMMMILGALVSFAICSSPSNASGGCGGENQMACNASPAPSSGPGAPTVTLSYNNGLAIYRDSNGNVTGQGDFMGTVTNGPVNSGPLDGPSIPKSSLINMEGTEMQMLNGIGFQWAGAGGIYVPFH